MITYCQILNLPQIQIFYIFATQCHRSFIFQTLKFVGLSLKSERSLPSCSKIIEIIKFEIVVSSISLQYLLENSYTINISDLEIRVG